MDESAIERDLRSRLDRLALSLRGHDRGVVLGALLCACPLPPTAVAGLVVSVINLGLIRSGKLSSRELPFVRASLLVGATAFAIGSLAIFFLVSKLGAAAFEALLHAIRRVEETLLPGLARPAPGDRAFDI